MVADSKLEESIDKILSQSQTELLSNLQESRDEALGTLSKSQSSLEQEYDKIIDEGKKEAEKIEKQIIGSSDLESRNKQLTLVQEHIEKAFESATKKIESTDRNDDYSKLITTLIEESIQALGISDVVIHSNSKDKEITQSVLSKFSGAELSSETIDCLGGVEVKSKDGTMTFDNTIDARIERMKPLIRKEIASSFGIGN
jgi:V/A-type H+-transporting ATPase subunit E